MEAIIYNNLMIYFFMKPSVKVMKKMGVTVTLLLLSVTIYLVFEKPIVIFLKDFIKKVIVKLWCISSPIISIFSPDILRQLKAIYILIYSVPLL
jgi:hypothetical protein